MREPHETVSKSKLRAHALEYFPRVERTGRELVVTDHGRPVLKIVPYKTDVAVALQSLRGTVLSYDDPAEPVAVEDWSL